MKVMQITIPKEDAIIDVEEFCIWIAVSDGIEMIENKEEKEFATYELSETCYDEIVPGVDFVIQRS